MDDLETLKALNAAASSVSRPYTGIAVKDDGEPFIVRCEIGGWIQDAKAMLGPLARGAEGHLIAVLPGHHQDRILVTWQPNFN
jgi:hypothetical protein